MKQSNTKRILAFFLVFMMVFSILPFHPSANTKVSFSDKLEASLKNRKESDLVDIIVRLKEEADLSDAAPEDVESLLRETREKSQASLLSFIKEGMERGEIEEYTSFFIINSIRIKGKASILSALGERNDVESIRENHRLRAEKEEKVRLRRALSETSEHIPWNLKSIQADQVKVSGKGIIVGIIDSGVNPRHPELEGAMEENGFMDFIEPSNTVPKDSTGHGTHVAGTILGRTLGVAKSATFIAARVFDENGEGSDAALLKAGEWILTKKPHIVNNSWSGQRDDKFYQDIIDKWRKAGIFPIFSAGNVGPFNPGGEGSIGNPGSLKGAFSVGALRKDDKLAKFSLRGPAKDLDDIKPEISAPGVNIRSANYKGGYILKSGTSMAGPHVSGAAALMLEANKTLSPEDIEKILKETATPLTDDDYISSPNMGYGYGKLNVLRAVTAAEKNSTVDFATFTGRTLIPGSDEDRPVIHAVTPSTLYKAYDFEIEASVSDLSGVRSVSLLLKNEGQESYTKKELSLYKGNKKSGQYSVTLHPDDLSGNRVSYYLEAEDTSGNIAKTKEIDAAVLTGIGIGYKNGFEDGADGFVFGGKTPMWEVGTPENVGPESAHQGKNVVGTNLKGGYEGLVNSLLISPPIDLTDVTEDLVLNFWDWSELGNNQGALEDSAEVWIGEIDSTNPGISAIKYESSPVLINKYSKKFWKEHTIDLSKYKGKKIIAMFALRWGGGSKRTEAGYYIDDFSIEKMSDEKPVPPSEGLRIENRDGDGKIWIYFDAVANKDVKKYNLYRSVFKDKEFVKVSTDTSPFIDYPNPQNGTYYYKIKSVKGSTESDFSKALSLTFTEGKEVVKFNFENGEEGWTSPSKEKWERGIPDSGSYGEGPGDTRTKNKGSDTVFMTGLNKDRKVNERYELLSPVINLGGLTEANLYYQNWYKFEGKRDGIDNQDQAEIWFRTDENSPWEQVFHLDEQTFKAKNINGHKRATNAWIVDGVKIPNKFLTSTFQMKFVLDAKNDYSYPAGWYIDDVAIHDLSKTSSSGSLSEEDEGNSFSFIEEASVFSPLGKPLSTASGTDTKKSIPVSATVLILDTNTYIQSEIGSGSFTIKHPAGTFKALAYNATHRSEPFDILLEKGKILTEDILLSPIRTSTLSLSVKDRSGKSVNGDIRIFADGESSPKYVLHSVSGANIADVPHGTYRLLISASGYKTHEQTILPGASLALGDISLIPLSKEGEVKELKYDSGNIADAKIVAPMKNEASLSVLFRIEEESILKSVSFGLKKSSLASIAGKPFKYSIYSANDKDGYPGRILFGPVNVAVENDNDFTKITLPDLYVKGDLYITYTQVGEGEGVPRIAVDEKTVGAGKTFKMINGAWNEASEAGMYMVRAEIQKVKAEEKNVAPKNPDPSPTPSLPTPLLPDRKEEKTTDSKRDDSSSKVSEHKENQVKDLVASIEETLLAKLSRIEHKISLLEKRKQKALNLNSYLKARKKRVTVDVKRFKKSKDFSDIRIKIKGLKIGKDYETFYTLSKGKVKILILGKGRFKGHFTKFLKWK